MPTSLPETIQEPLSPPTGRTVIELTVANHAGVMSHVCGLFARRAFNLEGILCGPVGDATHSVILLLVNEDRRLDQLVRQLERLYDVESVQLRNDVNEGVFNPNRRQ
jgi:acetolactate synthase I/III small subunit